MRSGRDHFLAFGTGALVLLATGVSWYGAFDNLARLFRSSSPLESLGFACLVVLFGAAGLLLVLVIGAALITLNEGPRPPEVSE